MIQGRRESLTSYLRRFESLLLIIGIEEARSEEQNSYRVSLVTGLNLYTFNNVKEGLSDLDISETLKRLKTYTELDDWQDMDKVEPMPPAQIAALGSLELARPMQGQQRNFGMSRLGRSQFTPRTPYRYSEGARLTEPVGTSDVARPRRPITSTESTTPSGCNLCGHTHATEKCKGKGATGWSVYTKGPPRRVQFRTMESHSQKAHGSGRKSESAAIKGRVPRGGNFISTST